MSAASGKHEIYMYYHSFSKVKNWPHKVSAGHLEELEGMCSTVDGYFYPDVD